MSSWADLMMNICLPNSIPQASSSKRGLRSSRLNSINASVRPVIVGSISATYGSTSGGGPLGGAGVSGGAAVGSPGDTSVGGGVAIGSLVTVGAGVGEGARRWARPRWRGSGSRWR